MSALLLENFEALAGAPGGIERLRTLIYEMAVAGLLHAPNRTAWRDCALADIGEWGSGGTPLKANAEYYGGDIPWLVIGDLNDGIVTSSETCITQAGIENSSAKLVPKGAVLIAMYGSIGKLGIAGMQCATNQAIAHCIVDQSKISSDYLFLFLKSARQKLISKGQGLAQQNISQKILKAVSVALPPLDEQVEVVAKVDELMALCDQLECRQSNAEAAHEKLVRELLATLTQSQSAEDFQSNWQRLATHFDALFTTEASIDALKQAVLQLAVMGRLAHQVPDSESASALIDRIAVEKGRLISEGKLKKSRVSADNQVPVDIQFSIPRGWVLASLSDLVLLITDGTHHTPTYLQDGVPFISVKDIDGETVSFDDCKFISEEEHREINQRCNPEAGDILLCRIGTLGRPTIVDTSRPFSLFVSVGLLKLPKSLSIARYLHIFLSSPLAYEQYDAIKAGGSHTNKLNLGDIPRITVPVPPLDEQHAVVAKVDELFVLCDALKLRLRNVRDAQDKLSSSLVEQLVA